jgi:3-hydroxy-9,10-secoandrosta-1,3,5(10)-triene-9,17-dione monooxygenase reductase component
VSIHSSDPFATPDDAKSPLRRLRGRLPAAVTLWTGFGRNGRPAGLTVSSTVVVDGDPGRLLGVIDPESDLYSAVQDSSRFAVCVLRTSDRRVADIFAGVMPAPGGPFRDGWVETTYGPVPAGEPTWAGCRLDAATPLGWGVLLTATIEAVRLGDDDPPLIHYRGRYADGPPGGPA